MSKLREAAEKALGLIYGAKLCKLNSISGRIEQQRLMGAAIDVLRAALAEPEQPNPDQARLLADIERYKTMLEVLERHVGRVERMAKREKELAAEPSGDTPSPVDEPIIDGYPLWSGLPGLCQCKARPKSDCPGEWEPGCDLGANEAHVEVADWKDPITQIIYHALCNMKSPPEGEHWEGFVARRATKGIRGLLAKQREPEQEPVTVFKTATTTSRWIEIPDDWALVPVEPSQEMIAAAFDALEIYPLEGNIRRHYRAMLAAAPQYKE